MPTAKVMPINPGPAVSGYPNTGSFYSTLLPTSFWPQIIEAAATGIPILLPPGTVYITTPPPASISGYRLNLYGQNTTLVWAGDTSIECLFPCVNLGRFTSYDVTYDGGGLANELISESITGSPGGDTPTQYVFKNGNFQNVAPGGICYHVSGNDNCDSTLFEQMVFGSPPGGVGFQSDNANCLTNNFTQCTMEQGQSAIVLNGGSFFAYGCTFAANSVSDIIINTQDAPCAIYSCFSQNSYKFLTIPYAAIPCNVTVSDTDTSSFPENWVYNGGSYLPTEISQVYARYGTIYCNRQYGLMVNNCIFEDPIAFAPVYAVSARSVMTEAISWVRNNAFTFNNSSAAYIQTIWNQQGTIT
jgi:hypothetical protein